MEYELKCVYWIFERIRYMLVVADWWQRVCEKEFLYWCNVLYIEFGECCLICMWLALNNLFRRVLVHSLLLAIYLFIHKVEKKKSFYKGKTRELWAFVRDHIQLFLKTHIHPLLVLSISEIHFQVGLNKWSNKKMIFSLNAVLWSWGNLWVELSWFTF